MESWSMGKLDNCQDPEVFYPVKPQPSGTEGRARVRLEFGMPREHVHAKEEGTSSRERKAKKKSCV